MTRKARPRAEWAESSREKQREYQKRSRMKCSADVSRETGERFRDICAAQGKTVSAVLAEYIRAQIAAQDAQIAAQTGEENDC